MNILIVTPFYYEPPLSKIGLMRLTQELSKHMKVIVLSTQIEGAKKYEEPNKNLKIYRVKPLLYWRSLPYFISPFLFRDIIRLYREENIDVVISITEYFWSSLMTSIVKRIMKFPSVSWVHGSGEEIGMPLIDLIREMYDKTCSRFIIKSADRVFILTDSLRKRAINLGVSEDKIVVMPNGIDTDKFRPDLDSGNVKKEFGISSNEKVITFIGRFYPIKGVEYLIGASKEILKDNPDCKFILLGDGPQREEMIQMAGKINPEKFIFPGYRTDVAEILNLTDVVVLPSLFEGLPTTILEAYACGVPVVATGVGGTLDVLEDGKNGFLIPVKDKVSTSKKILTLINDEKLSNKVGKYNREYVVNKYSLKNVGKKVFNEVESLFKTATS